MGIFKLKEDSSRNETKEIIATYRLKLTGYVAKSLTGNCYPVELIIALFLPSDDKSERSQVVWTCFSIVVRSDSNKAFCV
jgi:hypothetical protein